MPGSAEAAAAATATSRALLVQEWLHGSRSQLTSVHHYHHYYHHHYRRRRRHLLVFLPVLLPATASCVRACALSKVKVDWSG